MVKTGLQGYPFFAGSSIRREVGMQQSFQKCSSQIGVKEEIFVIPYQVFRALHPMEQLMARALEKVGKVRIAKEEELNIR
jgi:hypothetical protein